jgi:uncharacterized protein YndB with AHSA1/START domain
VYPVSRHDLFAAWTSRSAWDGWMRLRARSRTSLTAYRGGAFRLELAEGPTIHVITGEVTEIQSPDHLSLTWLHHNGTNETSRVDVSFRSRPDQSDLSLLHSRISNRREAAWLMRVWSTVLRELGEYLAEPGPGRSAERDPTARAHARLRRTREGLPWAGDLAVASATAVSGPSS